MSEVGTVREWVDIAERQAAGEDTTIPHFHYRPVQNALKTNEQGRPIFDEVAYVEVITPGDKLSRPCFRVTDEHKTRWPAAWAQFERTHEETYGEGTPVEQWPFLSRAQVAEFKALGIHTVEALAGLSDQGLQQIGPGSRDLQERARQFLQPQSDTETELREQIAALEAQLHQVTADNERLVLDEGAEAPRKRGKRAQAA